MPAFTSNASTALCGGLNYTLTNASGGLLNSAFTFTESNMSFAMYTTNTSLTSISPYTVTVTAYSLNYPNQTASYTFDVYIIVSCNYNYITAHPDFTTGNYIISNPNETINYGTFT